MDDTQNSVTSPAGQADASAAPAPAMQQSPAADLNQMAQVIPSQPAVMPAMDQAVPAMNAAPVTGPVTNEQVMEQLRHIEQKLDEMDEKL